MAVGRLSPSPSVRVEVLGPLRLVVDGASVDVPGPKRRAVLALLALAEGRTVTVYHLMDALWPSEVPESGRQALHNQVSRLRGHLGPAVARLETRQDGYRLALGRDELDVTQARALLATARTTAQRDPAGTFRLLQEAHGLWRGPVLAGLTDIPPVATAVEEYAQLRREVTDALIAGAVAAGQADGILGLAAASSAADPLREPAVLLLVRALAATGQAPEALRAGREYRRRLVDETGLDPSPALDELEREVIGGAEGSASGRREVPALPGVPTLPGVAAGPGAPTRPTTPLIGRSAQVAALHRLLAAERLVTLVGPGGVGKTRVALEVARQSGTVTVLLLAPVTDPAAIPHALAAALNLKVDRGDVLSACVAVLSDRPGLLMIDNCEHLLDGVRDTVDTILSTCSGISLLATSREPLGLAAEHVSRLAPLPLPHPDQDPSRVPSVALFLDRARRVRPGPPPTPAQLRTIADIVHRLDGMPLAIELAAGRLSTFSLADLRGRLDRSLDLLGGSSPSTDSRHRTLRATIEWSYQLLTEDERRLFRHLSVFVDGVDLDTAERLAADVGLESDPGSTLARLVDASMIEASFEGTTRYRMLETLRAFGLDRLAAAGEDKAAAERLLRWAVELTSWIGTAMDTEREPEADAVLRRELPNLRAAWRLVRGQGPLDDAVTMVAALFDAVAYRDLVEIRDWAEELADDPALADHPSAVAVLGVAAEAAYHRGDYRRADRLSRTGLAKAADSAGSWHCLMVLSVADLARGAYDDVVEHSLAAVELAGPQRESLGIAALAKAYAGDLEEARRLNDRGLAAAVSPSMLSWGAYVAGEIDSLAGHSEPAERHYLRAIDLARTSGATFLVGVATVGLHSVRACAGRVDEALDGYRDAIEYFARNGNWTHLWTALRNLADLLRRLGDDEPAALIDAAADQAPDAPAVEGTRPAPDRSHDAEPTAHTATAAATPIPGRPAVLEAARQAIERNLRRP
ncbi:AfsR/SARP family transcriptional regulator [Streptomyces albicerus]|uniref:AfsR/SARP family transcriptional regulator n=1 Tax=Streptomyces albicerus TaxID=2569859 RepID=UPI00124B021F|nr:BTAD domain-containing putative transcriptional regulator [Streptomyces albicerus]